MKSHPYTEYVPILFHDRIRVNLGILSGVLAVIVIGSTRIARQKSAGDRMSNEMPKGTATLHQPVEDPLGYDTSDPTWMLKAARHSLSGADKAAIQKEVDAAMRRWGLHKEANTAPSVPDTSDSCAPSDHDQEVRLRPLS
jgi:hypothetical protein